MYQKYGVYVSKVWCLGIRGMQYQGFTAFIHSRHPSGISPQADLLQLLIFNNVFTKKCQKQYNILIFFVPLCRFIG